MTQADQTQSASATVSIHQLDALLPTNPLSQQLRDAGAPQFNYSYQGAFYQGQGGEVCYGYWHSGQNIFFRLSPVDEARTAHYFREFPEYLEVALELSESAGLADRSAVIASIAAYS